MYLRPVQRAMPELIRIDLMCIFKQPYTEGKWKVKCAAGLSGKEKLGYGKKPMGTSRKQEVGGTSRKKRAVCLWVQNVCTDTTLAREHLHV